MPERAGFGAEVVRLRREAATRPAISEAGRGDG